MMRKGDAGSKTDLATRFDVAGEGDVDERTRGVREVSKKREEKWGMGRRGQ